MALTIAVLGGTGKEGQGLAARWSHAGYRVVIGSREAARGAEVADALRGRLGGDVDGTDNAEAARAGDIAVLTPRFEGIRDTLDDCAEGLSGKLVISAVIPLQVTAERQFLTRAVPEGSAAELAASLLPGSRVAAAFHSVSASHLLDLEHDLDEDVLLVADDEADRERVAELVRAIGARPVAAGPLNLARYLEDVTALLLNVNRLQRVTAGLRLSGLPGT